MKIDAIVTNLVRVLRRSTLANFFLIQQRKMNIRI